MSSPHSNAVRVSPKRSILPLTLVHGKNALRARALGKFNRRLLLVDSQGKRYRVPLLNPKRGILQGVYEIQRGERKPERLYFYLETFTQNAGAGKLVVYTNKGKKVAEFQPTLAHRKVAPSYQGQRIGSAAFDILEEHLALTNSLRGVILNTEKKDTAAFLVGRGYRGFTATDRQQLADYVYTAIGGLNRASTKSKIPEDISLVKKWRADAKKKYWTDLTKFHRIAIKGRDGKAKYWYGRVFSPHQ